MNQNSLIDRIKTHKRDFNLSESENSALGIEYNLKL